ncbi:MAG TPA: hypothetical protein VGF34_14345 [Stellaceae bacterium]|jgi:hypothetical protein
MTMPFDTLRLARQLEAAGFAAQQAGDMAEAIAEAISALATKADVLAVKTDVVAVRADLAALAAATKADLAALEMRIDSKLEILKRDMTIRLGSMMVVAVGVILAGFKLIH